MLDSSDHFDLTLILIELVIVVVLKANFFTVTLIVVRVVALTARRLSQAFALGQEDVGVIYGLCGVCLIDCLVLLLQLVGDLRCA